jgi:hypothetical protein
MDSKPVSAVDSNLEVASNVWAKPDGLRASPWEAAEHVPGDLRAKLQGTEDKRVIERELNKKQFGEYLAYKFFLTFGVDTDSKAKSRQLFVRLKHKPE